MNETCKKSLLEDIAYKMNYDRKKTKKFTKWRVSKESGRVLPKILVKFEFCLEEKTGGSLHGEEKISKSLNINIHSYVHA